MLWLESLAARQGADSSELTTSADLEVEELPEDTVVDEPGYVPYDVIAGGPKKDQEPAPEPESPAPESIEPEVLPEPELESAADLLADIEMDEVSAEALGEMFGELTEEEAAMLDGADPMEWLESLAKRQGAKTEEFTPTTYQTPSIWRRPGPPLSPLHVLVPLE